MKLLIVEGNPRSIWQQRQAQGGTPYHLRFIQLLHYLGYDNVEVAFPVESNSLPNSKQLQQFSGILLTGSSLNVYEELAAVTSQLNFAEQCFASGVPIYGSCWGLQVAVTIAGGKIGKSQKGREFGVAENITLTEAGKNSCYFTDKPAVFDAYCIHEDDAHKLPENTEVLATNMHSSVQALRLHYRRSMFFGVQYHPEFTYDDVTFLSVIMHQRLTAEGIFSTQRSKAAYLSEMASNAILNNVDLHTTEIRNWLASLSA